jgi:hypothetical protein
MDEWWLLLGWCFCFKRDDERVWTTAFADSLKIKMILVNQLAGLKA